MSPLLIVLIVLLSIFVVSTIAMYIFTFRIAIMVYKKFFVRNDEEDWNRGTCTFPDDKECMEMFHSGMDWYEGVKSYVKEVSIENDGLKLCGQYFDFGFKKAVLVLAGRGEALTYSYYFAEPYKDLGYNILVIDTRSHGLSEGTFNSVGLLEYRDVIKWIKLLHNEYNNEKVLLHGICIGSANSVYAATSPECPDCIEGLILDGMYVDFRETFKNHVTYIGKPTFPVVGEVMLIMRLRSGKSPKKFSPYKFIDKVKQPVLFIYGKQDAFSVPEKSKLLINKCKSEKQVVWFEKGAHSHLRINAEEKYDKSIENFIKTLK